MEGVRGWQVEVFGLSEVFGGIFIGFLVVFWDCLRCVCWVSGNVGGVSGYVGGVSGYVGAGVPGYVWSVWVCQGLSRSYP